MALRFLGKKSLALAIPVLAELLLAFDLAGLQGQIAALLQLTVTFTPPSIVGILAITGAIGVALPNFKPPTFDLKADLKLKLALLEAKLKLLLKIKDLLLAAGVHVYAYDGKANALGAALTSEMSPGPSQGGIVGAEQIYAVMLVVEANASATTVTSVKTVFGDT